MYITTLTQQDNSLGFRLMEIENHEKYLTSPPYVQAVVKNISEKERLVKINSIQGKEAYLHQWYDGEKWAPCCNHPVDKGLKFFELYCDLYEEFEKHSLTCTSNEINQLVLENLGRDIQEKAKRNIIKRGLK
jgi:hypothetical protein